MICLVIYRWKTKKTKKKKKKNEKKTKNWWTMLKYDQFIREVLVHSDSLDFLLLSLKRVRIFAHALISCE